MLGAEAPGGDDQALDFAGAFEDFGDGGGAVVALDGIFAGVAVGAVDLNGFAGGAAHCGRLAPVADQPTTLVKVPISSMEMRISSEDCKVKASGGTMPVPVSKKQPEGKTLSRKR